MKKLNILKQKLKGKAQQVKGIIEDASGQHVKGKMDKLRGKTNETVANIRNKFSK